MSGERAAPGGAAGAAALCAAERPASPGPAVPAGPRLCRWALLLLVPVLLGQMAFAMVTAAREQTPTIDEPVYVAAAADLLRARELRLNPEHPPLGKLLIAAGVAVARPSVPAYTPDQTEAGRRLLYESGNDAWRVMLWARLPVIALTLGLGLVVFAFARDLAGLPGATAALALYCFSPDLIAHGALATLDMPATAFTLVSAWLLWRARLRPRRYLPLAGAAAGAALATKMSVLPLVPVLLGLAAWSVLRHDSPGTPARRRAARAAAGAAVVGVVAVAVVWLTYLVVDPSLRWTPRVPVPEASGVRAWLVEPLPFPEAYRDGLRIQFWLEGRQWEGFLFGRVHSGGLWYYLPAALLVKTPLGLLALGAAGTTALLAVRRLRPAAPYVLLPAAVTLLAAMPGARTFGTRYVLIVPVCLAVAAAVLLVPRRRGLSWAVAALALWTAVSSLRAFPFHLPYANEAFGGPDATHRHLHDAAVDWGQDLGRLAERLRERRSPRPVWLVYKGSGVPSWYGIDAADPLRVPPERVRGLLVVSDSAAAKADGRLAALLKDSTPVEHVGYSITIYRR